MTYHDKVQLTLIIIAPPDQAEDGDRLFQSHGSWMESTHYHTGEKALLSYNASPRRRSSRTPWISTLLRPATRVLS
jgi:hypothetical protein